MKKHVYADRGDTLVRVEDDTPECGKDFCDRCGDCLHCYGGDGCVDGTDQAGDHFWVVYLKEPETAKETT